MAAQLPARSILKQESTQPTDAEQKEAKVARDRRNLGIALHYANKIQTRKDIELRIFGNIETLLEFPSAIPFSSSDASRFVSLVRAFQPSDYDNLVEERRIDGKCGYCLCPKPPRSKTLGSSAAWKLRSKAAGDYCSNDCTRKALYVKTQLSEVPAWERESGQHPRIVLHMNDRSPPTLRTSTDVPTSISNRQELATERGEAVSSIRPSNVMTENVVEGVSQIVSTHQVESMTTSLHTAVDGYEPVMQPESTGSSATTGTSTNGGTNRPAQDADEEESWRDLFSNVEGPS